MLTIELRVNSHLIAFAKVRNISDCAPISDYAFTIINEPSPVTGDPGGVINGEIEKHARIQSAWALVEKIAREAQRATKDGEYGEQ